MLETNANSERLQRSYNELVELQLVLEKVCGGAVQGPLRLPPPPRSSSRRVHGASCQPGRPRRRRR
jgi:hypothetical protein